MNFARKTKGSPEAAIRDIVKTMTYSELTSMARDIGIEPYILNSWAAGNFTSQPLTLGAQARDLSAKLPTPTNDNQRDPAPSTPINPIPTSPTPII